MPQIKVTADGFTLTCKLTCCTMERWARDDSGAPSDLEVTDSYVSTSPQTVTKNVEFAFALPDDVTIESAKVYATVSGSPLFGAAERTINGVSAGGNTGIDVSIDEGATSVSVPFTFLCGTPSHSHDPDNGDWASSNDWNNDDTWKYFAYYYWQHESALTYTDVYLLIDYTPNYVAPEMLAYTDPEPAAGETYVKAVHMTQLHTNTNRVRVAYGLPEYPFTAIVPGTPLAGWNEHVLELREAMDEIGIDHSAVASYVWYELDVNVPRVDVLKQLRSVLAWIRNGGIVIVPK